MPEIYVVSIATVAGIPEAFWRVHTPRRWEKSRKFLQERDRLRCLGAGFLLHRVLGVSEDDICCEEKGKPYVPNGRPYSLSHGGNYAVLAADDFPVGVDIEPMAEKHLSVANRVLQPAELAWMEKDPLTRFFALWTMKESLMKATGQGLSLSPKTISLQLLDAQSPKLWVYAQYHLRWMVYGDCILSVCAAHPFEEPQVQELFFSP